MKPFARGGKFSTCRVSAVEHGFMWHGVAGGDLPLAALDILKYGQFFKKRIDIDIATEGIEHRLHFRFFHEQSSLRLMIDT